MKMLYDSMESRDAKELMVLGKFRDRTNICLRTWREDLPAFGRHNKAYTGNNTREATKNTGLCTALEKSPFWPDVGFQE